MMQNPDLAKDYLRRATFRLEAIAVLLKLKSYADVVRESQEAVELALKGLLRTFGVEPPRIHDVSAILLKEQQRFPTSLRTAIERMADISRDMRRDRELAFYGTEDLTPSDFYSAKDAAKALDAATFVVQTVSPLVLK